VTGARVLPQYGGRCFSELPALIERLLGEGDLENDVELFRRGYDRVVLIYIDAFGWRFVERHGDHPLLARGIVERWTSQFPSTTTAHTTTIQSGLPVGVHGLYEWNVYEPALDRIVTPLFFCFAGDDERDTLVEIGYRPEQIFPSESLYARLGVPCHMAQPKEILASPVGRYLLRDAIAHGFDDTDEGLATLARVLAGEERAFGGIYLPDVDSAMHMVGTDHAVASEMFDATLSEIDGTRFPEGTLVLITADHGMEAISPERSVYANVAWPELAEHLETGADGKPLAPAGSCRDLFLHVRPNRLDDALAGLSAALEGVADVERVSDLLEQGVFGPETSDALRARLANLVVLPLPGEAVYWYERGRFEQPFHGQHGGLSPNEMEIPLVAYVA
jgi:hypothetical protein